LQTGGDARKGKFLKWITMPDLLELSKLTNGELDRRVRLHPDDGPYLLAVLRVLDERKSDGAEPYSSLDSRSAKGATY
jgi:hypothetical protein